MAQFVTQNDVDDLLHFAALSAATRLKVPDAEWESTATLVSAVSSRDAKLASALTEFMAAYIDWFKFHESIEAKGKTGNLDASENADLLKVIEARDTKRLAFIAALKAHA
jgi:hypothetical protein